MKNVRHVSSKKNYREEIISTSNIQMINLGVQVRERHRKERIVHHCKLTAKHNTGKAQKMC